MAKINYDYCESKNLYNSGDVEEILLQKHKNNIRINNGEYFYIMTPIRENIINWYPFKKEKTILEVGGGLGSITGALCDSGNEVTSCEYSRRRAENIYYRHKNRNNLEVIVGNVENIKFNKKFDYIVLIGVFEYAKRFFPNEKNPFEHFLNVLKRNLKDDGVILIAIENRYGIKYWSGACEDHYGEKFLGLRGYKKCDIQTFGKYELDCIINKSNFKYSKYYYPWPDYKMPNTIFSDSRLPQVTEISTLKLYNHYNDCYNFDYRDVLEGILDNKQYPFFANSFFVEITNNKNSISNVSFSKSNWNRNNAYQVTTTIYDNKKVVKIPKYDCAKKNLDQMIITNEKLSDLGLNVASIKKDKDVYEVEYIEGETLSEYIYQLYKCMDKEKIEEEIDKYASFIKSLSNNKIIKSYKDDKILNKYFSNKKMNTLKIGLLDLHMSNIIINNNEYYIIDQEWYSKKDIPTNMILYFSLNYIFSWIKDLDLLLSKKDLLKKYNITAQDIKAFCLISDNYFEKEMNAIDKTTFKIINEMTQVVVSDKENVNRLQNEINLYKDEVANISKELYDRITEVTLLKQEKERFLNSKSYKITKPFRKITKLVRGK